MMDDELLGLRLTFSHLPHTIPGLTANPQDGQFKT